MKKQKQRNYRRQALGGVSLSDMLTTAGGTAALATTVLTNPYVPEVLCRMSQVSAIRSNKVVPVCRNTPSVADSLGLDRFMPFVRAYAYAEARPWAYPVGLLVAVGVPFALGYLLGRKR